MGYDDRRQSSYLPASPLSAAGDMHTLEPPGHRPARRPRLARSRNGADRDRAWAGPADGGRNRAARHVPRWDWRAGRSHRAGGFAVQAGSLRGAGCPIMPSGESALRFVHGRRMLKSDPVQRNSSRVSIATAALLPAATVLLAAGIFALDTVTKIEIAVAVLYVAVVLLSVGF